jgi:hypothetical protein
MLIGRTAAGAARRRIAIVDACGVFRRRPARNVMVAVIEVLIDPVVFDRHHEFAPERVDIVQAGRAEIAP